VLALATSHAEPDAALSEVVEAMRPLGVRAVALHREVEPGEERSLAAYARMVRFVAIFGSRPLPGADRLVLVVEGRPAAGDRERSLEELCRALHPLRRWGLTVALRTPADPGAHPAPSELAQIAGALPFVRYWHDAARGGAAYLEAAGALLAGASFHPLGDVDLPGIRDALPSSGPAVVACPGGTPANELREAWACARGVFGA